MPLGVTIRPAVPGDEYALGVVGAATFLESYSETIPGPDLVKHCENEHAAKVYKGYKTFRNYCFRCHAINQQGGKIGPDLAAPKNILSYRKEAFLKRFIKKASSFRYTQMPDHEFLTETELDELISYLKSR